MASITIRNLADDLKGRLRLRAAANGHSMEEEARRILYEALPSEGDDAGMTGADLFARIRSRFAPDAFDLQPMPRTTPRPPPDLK